MLKNIAILICCFIIVLLCSIGNFSSIKEFSLDNVEQYFIKSKYLPDYPKGTIHIYIDEATFPTEMQLIDIVKREKETPKIISWNWKRFPNLNLDSYNVTKLDFGFRKELETYDERKLKAFIKELKNLKENDFVLHSSLLWVDSIMPILRALPKEKIKHIYLYEDGQANHLSLAVPLPNNKRNNVNEKELMQMIKKNKKFVSKYAYFLHNTYPVTYHISYWDKIKENQMLDNFIDVMKDADVKNIDIQEIANNITEEQKKALFDILNFDVDFYKKMIENKKVHFFVIGSDLTYNDNDLRKWFMQHNTPNNIMFVKGGSDVLDGRLIPAIIFPNQVPFEMLIIGGLTPTSVSGVVSTLFYAIPKENIGKIIYDKKDWSAGVMKQLKDLTDEQIEFSEVKFFKVINGVKKEEEWDIIYY